MRPKPLIPIRADMMKCSLVDLRFSTALSALRAGACQIGKHATAGALGLTRVPMQNTAREFFGIVPPWTFLVHHICLCKQCDIGTSGVGSNKFNLRLRW